METSAKENIGIDETVTTLIKEIMESEDLRQYHPRTDIIDPALMRPGRFDRHIQVKEPDEDARISIFEVHTKGMPLADDVDIKKLAKNTEGYVGADIEAVCREAAMLTLRDNLEASEIPYKYFKEEGRYLTFFI